MKTYNMLDELSLDLNPCDCGSTWIQEESLDDSSGAIFYFMECKSCGLKTEPTLIQNQTQFDWNTLAHKGNRIRELEIELETNEEIIEDLRREYNSLEDRMWEIEDDLSYYEKENDRIEDELEELRR